MMSSKYSRVCAEIDMDAIAENFRIMPRSDPPGNQNGCCNKNRWLRSRCSADRTDDTAGRLYLGICRRNDDRSDDPAEKSDYKTGADPGLYIRRRLRRSDPLRDRPIVFKLEMAKELSEAAVI